MNRTLLFFAHDALKERCSYGELAKTTGHILNKPRVSLSVLCSYWGCSEWGRSTMVFLMLGRELEAFPPRLQVTLAGRRHSSLYLGGDWRAGGLRRVRLVLAILLRGSGLRCWRRRRGGSHGCEATALGSVLCFGDRRQVQGRRFGSRSCMS
jgi:hypothetical protein